MRAIASDIRFKICGLTTPEDVTAVAEAGGHYAGLVFFPRSPRHLGLDQAARLAAVAPPGLCKVALTVNGTDDEIDAILQAVPIDMLQLHGSETPERVVELKSRTGLPVMKAVGVADASDVAALDTYGRVADQLLVDAKPPKDSELPGGNGLSFDWTLLQGRRWPVPWMLAGGLDATNVAEAVVRTSARQVDLSSGVESAFGVKDHGMIFDFAAAVAAVSATPVPKLV